MKTEKQNNVIFYIKQVRESLGYSQKRLADLLGVSHGQIGNIESLRTSHKYTLEQIQCICEVFNIRIELVFLQEDEIVKSKNLIDSLIKEIVKYEQKK